MKPTFWETVHLLLWTAGVRAAGRRKRQSELLRNRAGKGAINWGGFGFFLTAIFMMVLSLIAAFILNNAVKAGQRVQIERDGKFLVDPYSLYLRNFETMARDAEFEEGGDREDIRKRMADDYEAHGARDFISETGKTPGLEAPFAVRSVPAFMGSLVLLWWGVMLVFQGEGLELDLQRRRHPMWEWLFSHPAPPGAIFLAEMLSPLAANPVYWGAPLFAGLVYGFAYNAGLGLLAAALIGPPLAVAAACAGKALETGIVLRFSPRSRGAMIGIMSWLGYSSMMLMMLALYATFDRQPLMWAGRLLAPLAALPWPWLGLFLGTTVHGHLSFPLGIITCWLGSAAAIAGSIRFSVWGAQQGLSGNFGDTVPVASHTRVAQFGKDPLYRKEVLWFLRDRSAIVQTILIPLTVAGYQVFNLRGVIMSARGQWNMLCGVGILFGTYFLWVLGPKSLSSEGTALWIALTWPRGMENLLKAKAWLWSLIASGIVGLVMIAAAILFPHQIPRIALLAIGWFFFGRSMAEKTVTLVTVTSSSGEQEKIPSSRRWAASLGMLTFAIGVFTQQWPIAFMGVVYSYLTAAAMWQNFRARLPYLYDPWSEKLPPPPTLMNAMIAISILAELAATMACVGMIFTQGKSLGVIMPIMYCASAVIVSLCTISFLDHRGVTLRMVRLWDDVNPAPLRLEMLAVGALGGLVLGAFGNGYVDALHHFSFAAPYIDEARRQMANTPQRVAYSIAAIGFAPFAEEYLFRGLLYRALDREWGGWKAVVGSGLFFAIYHPPLAWLPVGLLGVCNALLYRKTGRLAPAILMHMVYNITVTMMM